MPKDTKKLQALKHYCYMITNIQNGKVYVGVTHKSLDKRLQEHIKVSRFSDEKKKRTIHKAIAKYGKENFSIILLEEFPNAELAYQAESKYIVLHNSKKMGYNESDGGDRGPLRIKYDLGIYDTGSYVWNKVTCKRCLKMRK